MAGCSIFEATRKNCGESSGAYKTGRARFKTNKKKEIVKRSSLTLGIKSLTLDNRETNKYVKLNLKLIDTLIWD